MSTSGTKSLLNDCTKILKLKTHKNIIPRHQYSKITYMPRRLILYFKFNNRYIKHYT